MRSVTPALVLKAYAAGLFPMADSRHDPELFWVDPHSRGIIPLAAFHVPRRLKRTVRAGRFEVRVNSDFIGVLRSCAALAKGRPETWINEAIVALYLALHEQGHAHSVESWLDGRLAGGLYGVTLGAAFFGESMFSRERDASKVALVHLVARLRMGGFRLLDAQFYTRHLGQFGAVEVQRRDYLERLRSALAADASFPIELGAAELEACLQSSTQTS
jgi:leucyl/phenylalanyl-tRNA---protein transferase